MTQRETGPAFSGEYVPSPRDWVREQVEAYERTNGQEGGDVRGMPVIIITTVGVRTGAVRKTPLMRVEHDGVYVAITSYGGRPQHPAWYRNVLAQPRVVLQDREVISEVVAREVDGPEKALWWQRAVAAYPLYAEYQKASPREIPLFLLEPPTA